MRLEDRFELAELAARYAEAVDWKNWPLLEKVFTADCVFDLTSRGGPRLDSCEAISRHLQRGPIALAHIISNLTLEPKSDDHVVMRTRVLGILPGGVVRAGAYEDQVRRTPEGWRIAERKYTPHDIAMFAGKTKPEY